MTEAELHGRVVALAADLGLRVSFRRRAWQDAGAGLPDLILVGRRGVLWAELKSAGGKLSPDQKGWRDDLIAAGQAWRLWRPSHLASGCIESELKEIAGPAAGGASAPAPDHRGDRG